MRLVTFIKQNPNLTPLEIAEKLSTSLNCVYRSAKLAGVKLPPARRNANRFDNIIRENYGKMSAVEMAQLIGQNTNFIRNRIHFLQLAKPKEKCTWYEQTESEYFDVSARHNWLVEEGRD